MAPYKGFFTDIMDEIKTALLAIGGGTKYERVFFGEIDEGEFFAVNKPAISLQFQGGTKSEAMNRLWTWELLVIYIKYDPKFDDNYDVLDDAETLMDELEVILDTLSTAGLRMHGDVTGMTTFKIDHDESYVFGSATTLGIERKEVES